MPPPLIGGGIKRWCCLMSVCLSCTSGQSREQRGLGRLKLARDSDTTFKVRRSKFKVTRPLYSPRVNASGSCTAVSVGTYWAWEPTATLPSAGAAVGSAARGASAPTEWGEGRGYIVAARPPTACWSCCDFDVDAVFLYIFIFSFDFMTCLAALLA